MNKNSIAIVGASGSGKTALLSVLTHKYQTPMDGYCLQCKNKRAGDFVKTNWNLLKNGEWPPPTPPGENELLDWDLHYKNKIIKILTADIAGETWIEFINEHGDRPEDEHALKRFTDYIINGSKNIISPEKKDLSNIYNLLKYSSCVLVLLNLADIIDSKSNGSIQEWLPNAIQNYLDKVKSRNSMAIVLTQIDRYSYYYEECGQKWENVISKYIPSLNILIQKKHPVIIPVAAVADTKADDKDNLVPAEDFKSVGLNELLNWIVNKYSKQKIKIILKITLFSLFMLCVPVVIIAIIIILYPHFGFTAFLAGGFLFLLYFISIGLLIYLKVRQ